MSHDVMSTIRDAIKTRHLLQINYNGNGEPGFRTVEPHMVADTRAGNLALSAWFLHGNSASNEGGGWRTYELSEISSATMLPQQFHGTRPGYKSNGGRNFTNIQCAL